MKRGRPSLLDEQETTQFIKIWNSSTSLQEVTRRFGKFTPGQLSSKAKSLRKNRGIVLRYLQGKRNAEVEVDTSLPSEVVEFTSLREKKARAVRGAARGYLRKQIALLASLGLNKAVKINPQVVSAATAVACLQSLRFAHPSFRLVGISLIEGNAYLFLKAENVKFPEVNEEIHDRRKS